MSALKHLAGNFGTGTNAWKKCTNPGCDRAAKVREFMAGWDTGACLCFPCASHARHVWAEALGDLDQQAVA